MKQKSAQLSKNITPEHYNLTVNPNLENFTFKGLVEIKLNLKSPSSKITLNSSELKLSNPKIIFKKSIMIPKLKENKKQEIIILTIPKKISKKATLSIKFQGILNDQLYGFYKSSYQYKNKTKILATTQFEAPYARKAFPCFDQPNMKATFSLSLIIQKNLKAISNMPILKQTTKKNSSTILFEKSPKMSTYLLYYGVGDFEFISTKYKNKTIRVVTTPGKSHQGKLALNLAKKCLTYFEKFSNISYPLPKLDLIAIPDFNAGAMENWGAITFREIILLYNPKSTSFQIKKRIAEVIAHELWHQWSGNLVTMEWWDDLWLNESFATYMAYKAIDHYFPKWNMWHDFVASETGWAYSEDSLKSTHPIAVQVSSPNEIEEIFDGISYGKGGSILRMIESYLGSKTFKKGISNYLKKHKYENAIASDLWNELSKVSNSPIKEVMSSWINQPGYPYLTINQQNNKLMITQKRFNSTKNQLWKIPLTIKTNSKILKILLTKKTQTIKLPKNTHWYKINNNQEGFYRTKYPQENLNKLYKLIASKILSPFDRSGIQSDLFNLTHINQSSLKTYFDFIKSYNNENSEFVLSSIYGKLYSTFLIFYNEKFWEKIWPKYKDHLIEPFKSNFNKLGWNPNIKDNLNDTQLRPLTISYLNFSEDKKIIKKGVSKFNSYISNKTPIHPDIKGAIFSIAAKNGNKKTYKTILNAYNKTKNIEEKIKLLSAIYKFQDPKILKQSLNFALTDKVRIQDLRTVFAVASSNPEIKKFFLPWTKSNWKKLKQFEKTHFVFMGLISSLIASHTGIKSETELKKFIKNKKIKYEKTKANAFETLRLNTRFLNNNREVIKNYFK